MALHWAWHARRVLPHVSTQLGTHRGADFLHHPYREDARMIHVFTHVLEAIEHTKWGRTHCWPLSGEGDPMYSHGLQVLPVTVAQDAVTRLDPYYTSSWL